MADAGAVGTASSPEVVFARVVGAMAHDVSNMLTAILGHAGLLQVTRPTAEELERHAVQIEEASAHAADLVMQLQRLVPVPAGFSTVEAVDVNGIVEAMAPLVLRSVEGLATCVFALSAKPVHVRLRRSRLELLLLDLVTEARERLGPQLQITVGTSHQVVTDARHGMDGTVGPGSYGTVSFVAVPLVPLSGALPAPTLPSIDEHRLTLAARVLRKAGVQLTVESGATRFQAIVFFAVDAPRVSPPPGRSAGH